MKADLGFAGKRGIFLITPTADIPPPVPGIVSSEYQKDIQTAVNKEYIKERYIKRDLGDNKYNLGNRIIKRNV